MPIGKLVHAGALSAQVQIRLLRDGAQFLYEPTPEVVGVAVRLHANEIEIHDRAQKICASWKCSKNLRSRPRQIVGSSRSQLVSQRVVSGSAARGIR